MPSAAATRRALDERAAGGAPFVFTGSAHAIVGAGDDVVLPTGPLLVPAAHAGDPMDMRIELSVNGRVMQDETTAT